MGFVLESVEPTAAKLSPARLDRLCRIIQSHIDEGRHPGAQLAIARHNKLAFYRSFGAARLEPAAVAPRDDTLWHVYSNTKVITTAAIWLLVEDGALTFDDRIADHVPEFARHGKGDITLIQLLTHQGGFPGAMLPSSVWEDHAAMRRLACDITLEWAPGSRIAYHPYAAHWVAAVLIEAVAGIDFRTFIRTRVIEPLGLGDELFVGLPDAEGGRTADIHMPSEDGKRHLRMSEENTPPFRRAGIPGAGGFATARAIAAFYQMMLNGGILNGTRLVSPRMVRYVTRNFTGDRVDTYKGRNLPTHRGLGPHSRGHTDNTRGLGALASPGTFGHGGVGSSYCWADPETGLSMAYLTNSILPDPWHSRRLDIISNCVHGAVEDA